MALYKATAISIPVELPEYTEHERPIQLTARFDKHAGHYAEATTTVQFALNSLRHTERALTQLARFGPNPNYAGAADKLYELAVKQKTRASATITRCAELAREEIIWTFYYRQFQTDMIREKSNAAAAATNTSAAAAAASKQAAAEDKAHASRETHRLMSGRKHWMSSLAKQEKYDSKKLEHEFESLQSTMRMYKLVNEEGYQL